MLTLSCLYVANLTTFVRHRDTAILGIGVVILQYIKSDVQKLLTFMRSYSSHKRLAEQGKYGALSDMVGRILD